MKPNFNQCCTLAILLVWSTLAWGAADGPYEPNDIRDQATVYYADTGLQAHEMYDENDLDWMVFSAEAGTSYNIEVPPMGNLSCATDKDAGVMDVDLDIRIELYNSQGQQLRTTDDCGPGKGERITNWEAPSNDFYYVLVAQCNAAFTSCDTLLQNAIYSLDVNIPNAPQVGSLRGTVLSSCDSTPIDGAQVTAELNSSLIDSKPTFSDGSYSMPLQPTSGTDYVITATASGFQTSNSSASILENQTTVRDFSLSPTGGCPPALPATPTGLLASDGTRSDRVLLSWDPVSGAGSYELIRTPDFSTNPGAFSLTSTEDMDVTAGIDYSYRVRACDGVSCSPYSLANTGYAANITQQPAVPAVPSNLTASDDVYTDRIAVEWSASTNTTLYYPYRCTAVSLTGCTSLSPTTSALAYDYVPAASYYYYSVYACNDTSCSDYSIPDSGSTKSPTAPTSITASDGLYADRVEISWSAVVDATGYRLFRCADTTAGTCALLASPTVNSHTDTTVVPGTFHYYRVGSCIGAVCGNYSAHYDQGHADSCAVKTITVANEVLGGAHLFCASERVTLGPGLQIENAANVEITAPAVSILPDTSVKSGAYFRAGQ